MILGIKPVASVVEGPSTARIRFHYLDGIRGLAALVVLLHHAYGFAIGGSTSQYPRVLVRIYNSFLYAHYAVGVFIVLSGYCLMLPITRSSGLQISGGLRSYFERRAWRILPPYYAALALSVAVVLVLSALHRQSAMAPPFTVTGLISFLCLVHNLRPEWAGQINPAFWSVASEWQIYFVFPFILLPLWRKFGPAFVLASSFLVTSVPYIVFHNLTFLTVACPWYITLFTFGMLGAYVSCSEDQKMAALRVRTPWQFAPVVLVVCLVSFAMLLSHSKAHWISDVALGMLFSAFLVYCTVSLRSSGGETLPFPIRFLGAVPVVNLGKFSYSIYLLHLPLLAVMNVLLYDIPFSPVFRFVCIIPLEMLIAVLGSYLFHILWEQHFVKPRASVLRKGTVSGSRQLG